MPRVHPTAVVSPLAEIGGGVVVEPFCVVEPDVTIGDDCRLGSHAVIKRGTVLGPGNQIGEGAIVGGLPQHINIPEQVGDLTIGANNVIREFCTIHRSLHEDQTTRIGDNNLLMVGVHVAHDCQIGNHVILTNSVLLAGHVVVEDRAFVSGGVGVHQFARIGCLAMVGGHARVVKDVPPYLTMDGGSSLIVGLNFVGLRRGGFSSKEITQLKAAYRVIYRRGLTWREVVSALQAEFPDGPAAEYHRFFIGGTRGFTAERRVPPGATVRLHREDDEPSIQSKAG